MSVFYASVYTSKPICLSLKESKNFLGKLKSLEISKGKLSKKLDNAICNDKIPSVAFVKLIEQEANFVDEIYKLINSFDEKNTLSYYRNLLRQTNQTEFLKWIE